VKIWIGSNTGGALRAEGDALVSVLDHGLTVGDGVFETLQADRGTVFAVTRHLDRLARSAEGLGLPAPNLGVAREALAETVAANEPADFARVRVTYTGGVAPLGSERSNGAPTLLIAVGPVGRPGPTAKVVTVPWARNERSAVAGLKTTSYAENVRAVARARAAGATEALFADTQGRLSEGTGSNVFIVKDGEIRTPALTAGCLAGITRALVLQWTAEAQSSADPTSPTVPVVTEADLPFPDALHTADEIFLTSTLRNVQAVVEVDGRPVVNGQMGPVTARVRDLFLARAATTPDPR
jgi:branched-chain amino acid aminotransferase